MARHRAGLRKMLNLKGRAHAAMSFITLSSPRVARGLDFFPAYALPAGLIIRHDDEIINPIVDIRYEAELAKMGLHNRETVQSGNHIPDFPKLRRVVWETGETYIPGHFIAPVNLSSGRIASCWKIGPTNWSVARPRLVRRQAQRIRGRAIIVPHMKHYGHLLTDVLAPIAFAAYRGVFSPSDPVTAVCSAADNPVSAAFLEGLGQLGYVSEIRRLDRDEGIVCDAYLHSEVLCTSGEHKYAFSEISHWLHEIFVCSGGYSYSHVASPKRIFLTRGAAKLRKLRGEAELLNELAARDFHIFEAGWTNHAEQLSMFRNSDIILGVHGAGLANTIFCKPSARLVEIQANNARKTTGLFWAACAGIDYTSVFGGAEGDRQSFSIDYKKIMRLLDEIYE